MKSKLILLLLSSLGRDKPKRETSDRGFTLIEVIVAMLILSVFIVASLTALVAGLNSKLKAKLNNEATLLIQQDLELVRYVAASPNIATVGSTLPTAAIASSVITVTLPINVNNTLSNSSVGAILKAGTATTGYTLAIKPTSTDTSISVTVDVTKTIKTTKLLDPSNTLSPIIKVSDPSKFAVGQRVLIGSSTSANVFVGTISSIAVNLITFSTAVNAVYPSDTAVTVLPSSSETVVDISACPSNNNTIATSSMALLSSVSLVPTPVSTNPAITVTPTGSTTPTTTKTVSQVLFNNDRTYAISRTATQSPVTNRTTNAYVSDFRVELNYKVAEPAALTTCETTNPNICLATLTTEVVPSVALQCP